jgi:hypothetical protein
VPVAEDTACPLTGPEVAGMGLLLELLLLPPPQALITATPATKPAARKAREPWVRSQSSDDEGGRRSGFNRAINLGSKTWPLRGVNDAIRQAADRGGRKP